MSQDPQQPLVNEAVELLVKRFGIDRVQSALAKAERVANESRGTRRPSRSRKAGVRLATVTQCLDEVQQRDEVKYQLLTNFYAELNDRTILPESQDIRFFAQIIGLKEIKGKSRRELVPPLIRFLASHTTERLQTEIASAANISEQQRRKGFSILTDKLLG